MTIGAVANRTDAQRSIFSGRLKLFEEYASAPACTSHLHGGRDGGSRGRHGIPWQAERDGPLARRVGGGRTKGVGGVGGLGGHVASTAATRHPHGRAGGAEDHSSRRHDHLSEQISG